MMRLSNFQSLPGDGQYQLIKNCIFHQDQILLSAGTISFIIVSCSIFLD